MNINPLTSDQRNYAIARLAEGLTKRAENTMHTTLSDGHVRSCYEGVFGEEIPKHPTINIQQPTSNVEERRAA